MKKKPLIGLFSGCLLLFVAQTTLADDLPKNSAQMSSILQNLQNKGYINVQKIKFEHGRFEALAINANGNIEKLNIDPKTGEIVNQPQNTSKPLSALEIAKKVEEAGYHNIYKLDAEEHNEYEVKALDKADKKVELKVDSSNGNITKK